MGLITPKEAADRLGLRGESSIYYRAKRGQMKLVRREVDGRMRSFVEEDDLTGMTAKPHRAHRLQAPIETVARPEPTDPLADALDDLASSVRAVRRALAAHDKVVRRQAVADLVESLHEGLKR